MPLPPFLSSSSRAIRSDSALIWSSIEDEDEEDVLEWETWKKSNIFFYQIIVPYLSDD